MIARNSAKQEITASEVREREGEAFENILVGGVADLATPFIVFKNLEGAGAHGKEKEPGGGFTIMDGFRHEELGK